MQASDHKPRKKPSQNENALLYLHDMKKLVTIIFLIFCAANLRGQGPEVLIPIPEKVETAKGTYTFRKKPKITTTINNEAFNSPEAYILEITPGGIIIEAGGAPGAFYARQSVIQMTADGKHKTLQCCKITDSPRFQYRGTHVDVSRHFRSVEFLKKHMDAMALFKMNRMHLHLTDAAGWRIEIKAYPRLTELAAWRPQSLWKDWWEGDRRYVEEGTPGAYGGYYTKDDIAELLAYAAERHIEIIPEIELPSHSEEVLAAYPELGCSGEAYKDSDFCVGNEKTFEFLEAVLTEVMDMFPSEYIHIGGDEAGKHHWKTCPKCQQRMKEEGLADVDELQSYMIRRIGEFVASKGRRIIGWDEILQGGLAPGATVMSWRGTEGGVQAMSQRHDVIMSPGRYCYLDHTQDAPHLEPESIGGYLPLDTVYVYEPVEPCMPEDKVHHLLGVQANLWSEYVPTDAHAEYMYWPRAFAIAETGWSLPQNKDLKDFRRRALNALQLLRGRGYTTFDLENEYGEREGVSTGIEHLGKGKKVTYATPVREWYPAAGETTFTDGIVGGWTYSDNRWQGFLSDIDVTIDMESVQKISYIGGTFMQLKGPGVFMPDKVAIYASEDGEEYTLIAEIDNDVPTDESRLTFRSFETECNIQARYVRYHAARSKMRGFLFLDEIIIN